jgi:large subunit ribosomal protein L4
MSPAKSTAAASAKAGAAAVLPPEIFDAKVNVPLIHQVVVAQEAAARQGTHSTKTRGDVRGGGRKPYRQKGTGRARQGSVRAPQYAGGGVVHGPHPRSYEQRTPKKMKAAALRGALSDRARHGRVQVVGSLVDSDTPKTKAAMAALRAVTGAAVAGQVLVVIAVGDELTRLSLRNAPGVHLLDSGQLNTRDVLVSDFVVFTQEALDSFVARMGGGSAEPAIQGGNGAGQASAAAASAPPSEAADEPATAGGAAGAAAPAKPKASRAKPKQQEDDQQ